MYRLQTEIAEITEFPIKWEEIVFGSRFIRNNKAAEEDNLPNKFYKIIIKYFN